MDLIDEIFRASFRAFAFMWQGWIWMLVGAGHVVAGGWRAVSEFIRPVFSGRFWLGPQVALVLGAAGLYIGKFDAKNSYVLFTVIGLFLALALFRLTVLADHQRAGSWRRDGNFITAASIALVFSVGLTPLGSGSYWCPPPPKPATRIVQKPVSFASAAQATSQIQCVDTSADALSRATCRNTGSRATIAVPAGQFWFYGLKLPVDLCQADVQFRARLTPHSPRGGAGWGYAVSPSADLRDLSHPRGRSLQHEFATQVSKGGKVIDENYSGLRMTDLATPAAPSEVSIPTDLDYQWHTWRLRPVANNQTSWEYERQVITQRPGGCGLLFLRVFNATLDVEITSITATTPIKVSAPPTPCKQPVRSIRDHF